MALKRRHIAMFVRPPVLGQVKTRLVPVLGVEGATQLYRAFVEDTIVIVKRLDDVGVTLWTAETPTDEVYRWALDLGAEVQEQPSGALDVRLARAFEDGLGAAKQVVAIGSDAPTLPCEYLENTFALLDHADLALGPAADGGYFSIGVRNRAPVLEGIRWSSPNTLADTVRVNRGRRIAQTAPWYDVDTPADLYLLRAHLSLVPASAPSSFRALRQIRPDSSRNTAWLL